MGQVEKMLVVFVVWTMFVFCLGSDTIIEWSCFCLKSQRSQSGLVRCCCSGKLFMFHRRIPSLTSRECQAKGSNHKSQLTAPGAAYLCLIPPFLTKGRTLIHTTHTFTLVETLLSKLFREYGLPWDKGQSLLLLWLQDEWLDPLMCKSLCRIYQHTYNTSPLSETA